MPVTPAGMEPFVIRPPLTTNDRGAPSDSLHGDAVRIFDLMQDERHLTAHTLYRDVLRRLNEKAEQAAAESTTTTPIADRSKSFSKTGSGNNNHKWQPLLSKHERQQRLRDREAAAAQAAQEETERAEVAQTKELLAARAAQLHVLENRCRLFRKAQQNVSAASASEWTLASTLFGIETYYRRQADGTLALKLQGEVRDLPLFEQVAVLKEVDLHHLWAPFCSASRTVADLDKLDTVGWFLIGLSSFGLARDGCFRAIGCDCIFEDGTILLAGRGIHDTVAPPETKKVAAESSSHSSAAADAAADEDDDEAAASAFLSEDPVLERLDIPAVPMRRGAARMTIHAFDAVIHVTSPTSAKTTIVAHVNPNISFLPQSLLEFIMKHLAGVLLSKLQAAAHKAVQHPLTNPHARQMRQESDFYQLWLYRKFQAVADVKGWTMPTVAAFALTDEQWDKEYEYLAKQQQKKKKQKQKDERRASPRRSATYPGGGDMTTPERSTIEFESSEGDDDDDNDTDRGQHQQQQHEDDSVSELTSQSGHSSRHRPGPLRHFLSHRRRDERRQRHDRQRAEIVRQQERSLQQQQQEEEEYSIQQQQGASLSPEEKSSSSVMEPPPSWSEQVTDQLKAHNPTTRTLVMASLALAFCLLMQLPAEWILRLATDHQAWIVVPTYLLACCMVHFALCDVALVYCAVDAFGASSSSASASATTTERQVQRYYSNQVRWVLGAMSLGIGALSLVQAVARVLLSLLLRAWVVPSEPEEAVDVTDAFSEAEEEELGTFDDGDAAAEAVDGSEEDENMDTVWKHIRPALQWTLQQAFLYNVSAVPLQGWWLLESASTEEEVSWSSWQVDALATARVFFLYTAVPWLLFLTLFHYLVVTRQQPRHDEPSERDAAATPVRRDSSHGSSQPPLPAAITTTPTTTTSATTTAEKAEEHHLATKSLPPQPHTPPAAATLRATLQQSRRHHQRRRLRFLRKGGRTATTTGSELGVVHEQPTSSDLEPSEHAPQRERAETS